MTDLIKPMAEFSVEGPLKSISFDIGSYNVVISESIVVQWIVMLYSASCSLSSAETSR